jgi:hypothetical protein
VRRGSAAFDEGASVDRSFARALLEAEGFKVVGEAADGESAVALARTLAPGGEESFDIIAYFFSPRGVRVDFERGRARGDGADSFRGFIAVVGSSGDDVLRGAAGTQWFVPLAGNDRVRGGAGAEDVPNAVR